MARRLIATSAVCALALLVASCDRKEQRKAAPVPAPSRLAPAPPALPVSGEIAFDLIAVPGGALLAWAERSEGAVRLRENELDSSGTLRLEPHTLATLAPGSNVVELAAASTRSAVAIAWIERGPQTLLRAVMGDAAIDAFEKPIPIAVASIGDASHRGNLALASDGERVFAFHRAEQEPCLDDRSRACTRFGFAELGGNGAELPRRVPLSVPAPCASAIAGFVVDPEHWHYAVCSVETGRARTTAFRIQYDPRYAEAHELLAGCNPAGAVRAAGDVFVAGDCPEGRRVARVGAMDARPSTLDLSRLEVACKLGHPVLSAAGEPRFELRLAEPKDGLAALLPPEIAPAGARAVWTGTTLIVARYATGTIALRRWACRGANWQRIAQ